MKKNNENEKRFVNGPSFTVTRRRPALPRSLKPALDAVNYVCAQYSVIANKQ